MMRDDARWFVGIDWASETHQVCLVDADGKIVGERGFSHGGSGLAEMCIWLLVTTRAEPTVIAVAIEVPHGLAPRSRPPKPQNIPASPQ